MSVIANLLILDKVEMEVYAGRMGLQTGCRQTIQIAVLYLLMNC
jgi:hypothetical protein